MYKLQIGSLREENDAHILNCVKNSNIIICALEEGKYKNRSKEIKTLLKSKGYTLYCLRLSKKEEPFVFKKGN